MARTGWVGVVAIVAALGSTPGGASALGLCMHCVAGGDCGIGGSYQFCLSGKIGDVPYCTLVGVCGGGGGGSGDEGIMRPRYGARPGSAAGDVSELRAAGRAPENSADVVLVLYALRIPIGPSVEPFLAGQLSWVARGQLAAHTAHGMLEAVAARAGRGADLVPVIEEFAALGPQSFSVAFAATDGDGFALAVEPAAGSTRVRLCAVRGRASDGSIADATLNEDDVLCARIRGGGRDYALVLTPRQLRVTSGEDGVGTAERQQFHAEAGRLTARTLDDGVRFQPIESLAGACH